MVLDPPALEDKKVSANEELRGQLSTEDLRKAADEFLGDATVTYNSLVERGGVALERLMGQPEFKDAAGRVEKFKQRQAKAKK